MKDMKFFDLSNPQKSIWDTEQYFKGTTVNNIGGTVIIKKKVDIERLNKAINLCLKNNKSFSLKFKMKSGELLQYFSDLKYENFEILNLKDSREVRKVYKEMSKEVFDIIENKLFKIKLFKLNNGYGGFCIMAHHIISDAGTFSIIVTEIIKTYTDLEKTEKLDQKDYSYEDYLIDEKEYEKSNKFIKDKNYWENLYQTIPEVATIPSMQLKNNADLSGKSQRKNFILDQNIFNDISNFCKKHKISNFNFFMAVYSIYIGRVCNLRDFVIGTPILNRTNFKEKHTTGMFINTVPLRIRINENMSFLDFVKKIASDSLQMLRYQKYPYQKLLENLRKKDNTIPTLFDVILSYQITKATDKSLKTPYKIEWFPNDTISNGIYIHLHDNNDTGTLNITYDYQIEKYMSQDILALHNRILYIIAQILKNENCLEKDIEIVTKEERNKILNIFNNTSTSYEKNKSVIQLFEEQVKESPNNTALVYNGESLTYKELNEKANSLANYMRKNYKIKKQDKVAVFLDKSLESIISIIAILKLGAIYVPIDIDYPSERINFILEDTKASLILTKEKFFNLLTENTPKLNVDLSDDIYRTSKIMFFKNKIKPDDLIYIMYTSGSTGKPKGVMIKHINVVRLVRNTNYIDFSKCKKILQTGSIVFDACTFEIWGALLNGLELYILEKEKLLNPKVLKQYLFDNKIDTLWLTAPLFNQLCEEDSKMFSSVKYLLTGGDVLSPKHINMVRKSNPNITLINGYGPTENTTFSCCFTIDKKYENSIPIGKPIANSTAYVVSMDGKLQPLSVRGELLVGGDGVGQGYLNRDDLTKDKFIKNPFGEGYVYKTGDLVKVLPDGNIDFIGRIDNQVKIRGFRVELSEIDNAINKFNGIFKVCTTINELNGNKSIVTYFTANKKIDIKELSKFLREKLPNYMVPSCFIQLDNFPLNINGKIERGKLPKPTLDTNLSNKVIKKAKSKIEKKLLEIYKDVLGLDDISIDDNFFDLGGDSLSAIKLSTKINEELKIQMGISILFDNPSIYELAKVLETVKSPIQSDLEIKSTSKKDFYPTSSAQKRLYFSTIKDGKDSILYNICGGLIFDKTPNIEKLNYCFNELIRKNESLRTSFEVIDGEIVQRIHNKVEFRIEEEKVNHSNLSRVSSDFIKPFDLSKAPLIKAKLTKLRNKKTLLLIDLHHIVGDGETVKIIIKEISDLYNGKTIDNKDIDYKDFAVWENNQDFKDCEEYWLDIYKDKTPILNLPTNYPRPALQSFEGDVISQKLDKNIVNSINDTCKKLNITPYMLLISVYYILLSEYAVTNDIIVGTPIIGRTNPQLKNIVGMFVNTIPIRNTVIQEETFMTFAERIKQNCLKAFENQSYPLDKLLQKLNLPKDTSRNMLFDVLFTYQNSSFPVTTFENIGAKFYVPKTNTSKFDLSLEAILEENTLSLNFEFCTKLFNNDFIQKLSIHYINILKQVLEDVNIKISEIGMISKNEKRQILNELNNTSTIYDSDKTVIKLFEEQIYKTPGKVAVVYGNEKLTYRQLNKKANQLANYIKKYFKIKKQDKIAIFMKKSIESIVAILATMKLGAIFVPIDIEYPEERIDFILKNSKAKLVLTLRQHSKLLNTKIEKLNINLKGNIYNSDNIYNPENNLTPEDLIYVMYTSGSTGTPKGVMVKHINVVRLVKDTNYIDFSKCKKILQTGSIVFDACTFEIWGALLNGLALYIINKNELLNTTTLEKYLISNKIDTLWLTAPLFNQLSEENPYMFRSVKYLLTGGDVLSPKHINMVREANPNITLINGYGPTENTTFSCCFTIDKKYETSIPIGKPIANSTVYIVSKNGKIQPKGVPGELWVGGDGVSKGYLNRKDLTKERFVKNPFGKGKIYKTGDLVKVLPDGNIDFIGRIDDQVKIRGFRVELSEIDNVIKQFPDILELLTIVKEINGSKTLITYFTSDLTLNTQDIMLYIKEKLPTYMVPQYLMQLESFPLTVNGKIDRDELPIPQIKTSNTYVAPENDFQEQLCDIWCDLFNMKKVSILDNFFELGGDSLLAIRFQTEALKRDIGITYSDIFEYQTIKSLSEKKYKKNLYKIHKKYDYSKLNDLLEINNISNIDETSEEIPVGNLLLFGATGFLGAHILDEYLSKTNANVYCLVRRKNNEDSELRLKSILNFYFEKKYDKEFGKRIFVVNGDITKENFELTKKEYSQLGKQIDVVVNSAALVKHYGDFNPFNSINVLGTKNILTFCKKFHKKLYHISTMSVAGMSEIDDDIKSDDERILFNENKLYVGQNLNNVYVYTKFLAEKELLQESQKGLDMCILRAGNIFSRVSDGRFQINVSENAYINRIKAILKLKVIQNRFSKHALEFTPVDSAAEAIVKIIKHNPKFNVLHLFNTNLIDFPDVITILNNLGYNIQMVSDKDFSDTVKEFLKHKSLKNQISGIIPDLNKKRTLSIVAKTLPNAYFTTQYLKSIGFEWPEINKEYMEQFLDYFKKIGYIE